MKCEHIPQVSCDDDSTSACLPPGLTWLLVQTLTLFEFLKLLSKVVIADSTSE